MTDSFKKKIKDNRFFKNYFILPKFQIKLIVFNLALNLFIFAFFLVQLRFGINELNKYGIQADLPNAHPYFDMIGKILSGFQDRFLLALIFMIITTFIANLFLSHKLAGPISRLTNYFRDASTSGVKAPIKFRKGDYIEDLAEPINLVLDQIKETRSS